MIRKAQLKSVSNLYLRDMRDPWYVGPGAFGAWIAAAIFAIVVCTSGDWILP